MKYMHIYIDLGEVKLNLSNIRKDKIIWSNNEILIVIS